MCLAVGCSRATLTMCFPPPQASVAINSLDSHTWFLVAVCAMKVDDLATAANALTRVIQQDPEAGEAWVNLGSVQMQRGKYVACCPWHRSWVPPSFTHQRSDTLAGLPAVAVQL